MTLWPVDKSEKNLEQEPVQIFLIQVQCKDAHC